MVSLLASIAQADLTQVTATIETNQTLQLRYKQGSWNKSTGQADVGYLMIHDADSKRVARVLMVETSANTGWFIGNYRFTSVAGSPRAPATEIAVYQAPSKWGIDQSAQIGRAIRTKALSPKYLVSDNNDRSSPRVLWIYDTESLAKEGASERRSIVTGLTKTRGAEEAAALAARKAQQDAEEAQAALARKAQELANIEQMSLLERMRFRFSQLPTAEQEARRKRARELADLGQTLYLSDKLQEALQNFDQSWRTDPNLESAIFQTGVALYALDRPKESLNYLSQIRDPSVSSTELSYYRGLNHLKLNDTKLAYSEFLDAEKGDNPSVAASAAFFAGVIDFKNEDFEAAKKRFQFVLDNSSDPRMDEQADSYIAQIASAERLKELQRNPWAAMFNLTMVNDSNILNAARTDTTTNLSGYRLIYGGTLERKFLIEERRQLSAILGVTDIYSLDRRFQADKTIQDTDPLILSLTVPYRLMGTYFGKAGQRSYVIGYENLALNLDKSGGRESILESTLGRIEQSLAMKEEWFSSYSAEIRNDRSLSESADENQQTAIKLTLNSTQTWFANPEKTKAWIQDLTFARNQALGKNIRSNRIDAGGTFLAPVGEQGAWTARLAVFILDFPDSEFAGSSEDPAGTTLKRRDFGSSWTIGYRRQLLQDLTGSVGFTYMDNQSRIASYRYDKTNLSLGLTYSARF